MSDFHRSLDRALEHDPHNDWGAGVRETMAAELGVHSAYGPPPVDRSFVDAFEPEPLLNIQAGINEMLERMVAAMTVETKHAQAIAAGFMLPLATQEIPGEGQE